MTDFASLTLQIDSSSAKEGAKALDQFADAGDRAGLAADSLTQKQINANAARITESEALQRSKDKYTEVSASVQKLLDRYDPLGTKLRQLQSDFSMLNKAATSGGLGAQNDRAVDSTYAALNAEITKTQALMAAAGVAGAEGFGKASEGAHNLGLNTAYARRELIILGREALSGEFSRMPSSFASLIAHTSLLGLLLNPVVLGIIALGTAAAGLAVAFAKGFAEQDRMNNALALTNNFAGMTSGSMVALAETMSKTSTMTIGHAKEIVTALVDSGRIGAGAMTSVATLASNYADATGTKSADVAKAMVKMFEDPAKAAETLNAQMHFLSVAQMDHIKYLQESGKLTESQNELAVISNAHIATATENLGYLAKGWRNATKSISEDINRMLDVGKTQSFIEQINQAQHLLETMKAQSGPNAPVAGSELNPAPATRSEIAAQEARVNNLKELLMLQQQLTGVESVTAENNRRNNEAAKAADVIAPTAALNKLIAERQKIAGWITENLDMQGNKTDQLMRKNEALLAVNKKIFELQNPGIAQLQGQTNSAINKKADDEIANIHRLAEANTISAMQEIELVNMVEDARDKATGAYADRLKAIAAEKKANEELAKEAFAQGAYQEALDLKTMEKNAARRIAQDKQIAGFSETTKEHVDQIRQEGQAYNKSRLEIEMGNEARKIENEYTKAQIGLDTDELAALKKIYDIRRAQIADAVGYKVISDNIITAQKKQAEESLHIWKTFVKDVQRTLGDQLYQVMQGNFRNIGQAFSQMLQRMLADALAANIMNSLMGSTSGGGGGWGGLIMAIFGAARGGGGGGGNYSMQGAKGAWFDGNASNFGMGGVVSSPTMFAYGGGFQSGIMGEAGPEAIMPLKRDSSGRLGVASAGGKATTINFSPVYNIDSGTDREKIRTDMVKISQQSNAELVEQLSRAGKI